MIVGLLCALAAAFAYGAASVLQALGVRRAGDQGPAGLVRQPLYLCGLALDGVGFVAAVVALQFLPLFLVQAVAAGSTGVTAAIATRMGTKLPRSGWYALAAAGLGLVLLSISANSDSGVQLPIFWRWFLLGLLIPLALMVVLGERLRLPASVLALGAGIGFAMVAIAARSLDLAGPIGGTLVNPVLWVIVGSGISGTLLFASALGSGSVTAVAAIAASTDTVIPAVVGLAVLGDSVRHGFVAVAVVGFLLSVAGAIVLARFAELGKGDLGPAATVGDTPDGSAGDQPVGATAIPDTP